jgi:HD-GYP domain-containing protein (c-di-GMP phosphodiesterase class II)
MEAPEGRETVATAVPDQALALRVKELEERLRRTQGSIVCGLSQILDLRDPNTGTHSARLAEWAVRIAEDFGLDEEHQRNLEVACILHDIGKIGVPDRILRKKGPLTQRERQRMNRHPEYGWAILRLFPGFELASLFALHHHERFDGRGYPGGLRGDGIPIGARIVTIVDAFDAMVSDRSYRKRLGLDDAARRLLADSGTQFDPELVKPFLKLAQGEGAQVELAEPSFEARADPTFRALREARLVGSAWSMLTTAGGAAGDAGALDLQGALFDSIRLRR